jgi:hypothetical protein
MHVHFFIDTQAGLMIESINYRQQRPKRVGQKMTSSLNFRKSYGFLPINDEIFKKLEKNRSPFS